MVRYKGKKKYKRKHPVKTLDVSLYNDIRRFKLRIERLANRKITFRRATELWLKHLKN